MTDSAQRWILLRDRAGGDLERAAHGGGHDFVSNQVIAGLGGDVGNLTVTLRSFNSTFGGFRSAQTDAAGNFTSFRFPEGAVTVFVEMPSRRLISFRQLQQLRRAERAAVQA